MSVDIRDAWASSPAQRAGRPARDAWASSPAQRAGRPARPLSVEWVIEAMERLAPVDSAEEWDNVGLMVGDREQTVDGVMVALDYNDSVAQEAVDEGVNIVITHHPLIFKPMKSVTEDTPLGRRIIQAIRNNIAIYAAHTNLDMARGGVNDVLFDHLELMDREDLGETRDGFALGRVGNIVPEIFLGELAILVGEKLGLDSVRYVGDKERLVNRVGICSGSSSEIKYLRWAVNKGCDVYITADIKYHEAQAADEMGLALIDATHFGSEIIAMEALRGYLTEEAQKTGVDLRVIVSKSERDVFKHLTFKDERKNKMTT